MVSEPEEMRAVRALMAQCRAELAAEGVAHGDPALGAMVETPAAALTADALARESAFFSIGTNDLTQYVMAADRTNARVARLNRAEHPAALAAVRLACEAGARAGVPVTICGEAAARPDLIPVYVGMGAGELSMSASSIPMAKKCIVAI
ncbi:MAG: phosphoenolpyruvate--protein phosphotransferase, partial [Hyphomicrobiales bacterium]|nr:phosphoenolpyruvate--protein phosphotransferase [Hyphomicrobiales bacterium]